MQDKKLMKVFEFVYFIEVSKREIAHLREEYEEGIEDQKKIANKSEIYDADQELYNADEKILDLKMKYIKKKEEELENRKRRIGIYHNELSKEMKSVADEVMHYLFTDFSDTAENEILAKYEIDIKDNKEKKDAIIGETRKMREELDHKQSIIVEHNKLFYKYIPQAEIDRIISDVNKLNEDIKYNNHLIEKYEFFIQKIENKVKKIRERLSIGKNKKDRKYPSLDASKILSMIDMLENRFRKYEDLESMQRNFEYIKIRRDEVGTIGMMHTQTIAHVRQNYHTVLESRGEEMNKLLLIVKEDFSLLIIESTNNMISKNVASVILKFLY